jgi:hypothetical protein
MSSNSDVARATALALLPLAAFLFGPALNAVAPESIPNDLLLSVLPTVLPLAALVVVVAVSYRRTGSVARALWITLNRVRRGSSRRRRIPPPRLVGGIRFVSRSSGDIPAHWPSQVETRRDTRLPRQVDVERRMIASRLGIVRV